MLLRFTIPAGQDQALSSSDPRFGQAGFRSHDHVSPPRQPVGQGAARLALPCTYTADDPRAPPSPCLLISLRMRGLCHCVILFPFPLCTLLHLAQALDEPSKALCIPISAGNLAFHFS
ncbi:uncharacterized protein BO80DRAFT_169866 [Aspergillus ibericus CBS 121593]|uniref:Uncharacterized protein n=1 Tax=Aspergillus ibericus CBS 121593 TaxID=1448316 RepID=A0A395HFD4_9EURO|nr:hypothetical protein BO80DRAFT_169866 [Aspergillus ibericus CBS 121593]RAL04934.1 hypothetical protein BO80DRAFT_169866 [Aspergillus ibericus CBS 121593]